MDLGNCPLLQGPKVAHCRSHPQNVAPPEQQIQEELDNAFYQVDVDRRAPPMENQHAAVEEQEEQILADYGDQDENDGEVELDDISFSCAGLSRISIIDGEVGDTQPLGKFLSFLEDPRTFEGRGRARVIRRFRKAHLENILPRGS